MNPRSNFYWSIRRELWENRSVYMAPLIVGSLAVIGFAIGMRKVHDHMRGVEKLVLAKQEVVVAMPFSITASLILVSSFLVALFYCADALYGERRDRSILFWKSMPVSDVTTVLSKAFMAVAVIPIIAFAIALATQLVLFVIAIGVMRATGIEASLMWGRLPFIEMTVVMLYGVLAHSLWYAPIYGWMLLVSAWAKRAVLLWALLPFFAIAVVEKLACDTTWFLTVIRYRLVGAMTEAFAPQAPQALILHVAQLDPVKYLSNRNLWLGLAFAAACLVLAVRLRRHREPI